MSTKGKSWADEESSEDDVASKVAASKPTPKSKIDWTADTESEEEEQDIKENKKSSDPLGLLSSDEEEEISYEEVNTAFTVNKPVLSETTEIVKPIEQLSKKERKAMKQKELEDLDALLGEFSLKKEPPEEVEDKDTVEMPADSSQVQGEKKKSKKKKKTGETTGEKPESTMSEPIQLVDISKAKSIGKKKASAPAKSAAQLAAVMAAIETKTDDKKKKKKDKTHYNQAPTR